MSITRRIAQRIRNWRHRRALEARIAAWLPPLGLLGEHREPLVSSERALGTLNSAWAALHRATHRPVAPDELRACQDSHRRALAAYRAACEREFGR